MSDIHKVAGILIKDRRLLFEKSYNKPFFVAPGGKLGLNETKEQALVRELKEEFTIDVDEEDFVYFDKFEAIGANHPDQEVIMEVYFVKKWQGEIKASSEVEKIAWVTSDNPDGLPLGSIFEKDIIPILVQLDLID